MDITQHPEKTFYRKDEYFDNERTEKLSYHYKEIIKLLGEDVEREGLLQTPLRVAKAMQFMTQGYGQNPEEILRSALLRRTTARWSLSKTSKYIPCVNITCSPLSAEPMSLTYPTDILPASVKLPVL